MVTKSLLLFRTVRHLKLKQVIYQLYYRLKPRKNLSWYKAKFPGPPTFNFLNFTTTFQLKHVGEGPMFNFLNLEHDFGDEINWDYQDYGKLWNYNLQYFNYLHQPDISSKLKVYWLHDIGLWLNTGKLKLEQYPVALRAMNTIRFLSREEIVDPVITADLFAQVVYLEDNLEYHLLGNHLLEDAFALFMAGAFFNNDSWCQKSKAILHNELNEQILNDGGHFELSPMYHQIILFRVLELIDWYNKLKDFDGHFLAFLKSKAENMLGWLRHITFKNGDIPNFNDSSDGIAFSTAELFAFAGLLNIKANDGLLLDGSGYRQISAAKYECVIDVGPVGPSYQPGHAHSDMLSFVLYSLSGPLIVDTGTSTYQIGERRTFERSTGAHNTVVISGQNQSEIWGGFRVGRRAKLDILIDEPGRLMASHNGYERKFGNTHKREFTFDNKNFSIIDIIQGESQYPTKALFHFHPDCKIELKNDKAIITDIATIEFAFAENAELLDYEFANGYNRYLPAKCLVLDFKKELRTTVTFL